LPKLTVLSREYCHLCEDFIAALKRFQGRYSFEIDVVDVDRHPELEEKWGDKVPVLLDGSLEICHYYLDNDAVDARLARMK
jgi:glutaredoxin